MTGNEVANLPEHFQLAAVLAWVLFCFHLLRVTQSKSSDQHFLSSSCGLLLTSNRHPSA
jgi:hypothetical protein